MCSELNYYKVFTFKEETDIGSLRLFKLNKNKMATKTHSNMGNKMRNLVSRHTVQELLFFP